MKIKTLILLVAISIVAILFLNANGRIKQEENNQPNDIINSYIPPIKESLSNEAPKITLYGANPYSIFHPGANIACDPPESCPPRTDVYKEPGYKAFDKEDGDITSRVIVTDEINDTGEISPCHTYNKRYDVKDSNGNKAVAQRTIEECFGM